ncbi:hypothetical protein [Labilithrix luteola]|uniref:hypothetical protein n=1 Tax=Labilithrix luteola TaxID=1391654 RepID=UPI0011BA79B3|nr:hypothetical protein [Labilithrix luteola]
MSRPRRVQGKAPSSRARSILVTDDGKRAFVSHATGSKLSVLDLDGAGEAGNHGAREVRLDMRERRRDFGMRFSGKVAKMAVPREPTERPTLEPPAANVTMTRTSNQGFALASIGGERCSSRHIEATRFTDGESHALNGPAFDTPSLAFVGQTAPYFHDGRFATLEELIDHCDPIMGKTRQLSEADRRALAAYLRTL